MRVRTRVLQLFREAIERGMAAGALPAEAGAALADLRLERPRNEEHGDYALSVALAVAKAAGKKPREVAEAIRANVRDDGGVCASIEIAGPGFLNVRVAPQHWGAWLAEMRRAGADWGRS